MIFFLKRLMNNYLIFRTDRIGDFLLSSILIKSIKRNDKSSYITVVCSDKNFDYVKNFHLVDNAILYPSVGILNKLNFLINLSKSKFFAVFVLDGKKRSLINSIFIKSKYKISIVTKYIYKFLLKFNFDIILHDDLTENKLDLLKSALFTLKFEILNNDLDVINPQKLISKLKNSSTSNLLFDKKFIMLHFDEKWIFDKYIQTYANIEPNLDTFKKFLHQIINTANTNLILTHGIKDNHIIESFKKHLNKINTDCYLENIDDKFIIFFDNTNFFDIEYLLNNSELLISCHGAPTHSASGLNKKIFDIIDESEKKLFEKFSNHFRNYSQFLRKDFNKLSNDILRALNN